MKSANNRVALRCGLVKTVETMKHVCEQLYKIGANGKVYGDEVGVCRITGKESKGVKFDKWVRGTFNDHDRLYPGTIISNEAMFCFDESSDIIQQKAGKANPQRFRTYSHIVKDGEWYCLTKADKKLIFKLIVGGADMVCLTDSGQKHILFKHKSGLWQLDDLHVQPNIELLTLLHYHMCQLLSLQFSQTEIILGAYQSNRILKAGSSRWLEHENIIKKHRGTGLFDFTSFMLFSDDKKAIPEPISKSGINK